ncbi:protein FAR1-RELATED SEQUENCE 5-like [Beta vulgaris subsp. vulgaris]|uniref:protein FAR1-RELATED SEQUENCE 5-like n=1 Tax=Beta vulgaris subsp. vulgaris TaxID=3555 RepID=UPI0025477DD8|nr:protein FAR1-RELATED SEQUENCE 5-like [Beta vulgaris subsp. vulgaris]
MGFLVFREIKALLFMTLRSFKLCEINRGIVSASDVEFEEGSESELLQKQVKSDEEAFELYNEYAFKFSFGVRKGKTRCRVKDGSICMRQMVCWRTGFKNVNNVGHKSYSKVDYRTGCRAYVQFHVDEDDVYTLVAHVMGHNHAMVPLHKRHYIRSHRLVRSEQLAFISNLKRSGIPVADVIRVMRKEVGGSPNLGFIASDAYNALAGEKVKSIDFSDSNQLIKFFTQSWIIVGIWNNHHTNNIMFGCAFLLNEKTDSFVWLFDSFVRSMGGKKPITMITDQCAAMGATLKVVLPSVNHRLCTWHIGKNSKKNIPDLRAQDDIVDVFNTVLKYSDTIAEFEFYWQRDFEKLFDAIQCPYNRKVAIAAYYLKEEADFRWSQHKETLMTRYDFDWKAFGGDMKKKFYPNFLRRQKATEFDELKQGDMTVDQYYKNL